MNEWWKDASRDAVAVGQDVETVTNHPPIRKTIVLPDFANDRERQQFDEAISFGPSAMVDICSEETPINRRMPLILHATDSPRNATTNGNGPCKTAFNTPQYDHLMRQMTANRCGEAARRARGFGCGECKKRPKSGIPISTNGLADKKSL